MMLWISQIEKSYSILQNCIILWLVCVCAPGLHGIPARRAPMVEQAVQTVPMASAAQKRGNPLPQQQGRRPVRPTQRSGQGVSQVQKENIPTSKHSGS